VQRFIALHARGAEIDALPERCLQQLGSARNEVTLGFLYATPACVEQLPRLLDKLRSCLPGVHWLGSVGEGVCATAQEYYDGPAVSMLLSDIPRQNFCLLGGSDDLFAQLPGGVMQWCEHHPDCFGLLHAVPTYLATSAYANEIRHYAPAARLNGGLSSGVGHYRHISDELLQHGISGVLFSAQQPIISAHSQGCTPISGRLQIDEAQRNMVLQLGGRPALEVLRESVGEVLWRDPQRLGNYIFVGLPADPCHGDDYMVRNLMGLDLEGGAIAVGDLMEHHPQLCFCRRDGNAAHDDLLAMLQRLKRELGGRVIRGGIYVSCVGRGRCQFGDDSEELKLIAEQLGDFPLAGFFANGEFFRGRLYSYTGVLTLFL
jgi:small ligand-binding sensory domain FIST